MNTSFIHHIYSIMFTKIKHIILVTSKRVSPNAEPWTSLTLPDRFFPWQRETILGPLRGHRIPSSEATIYIMLRLVLRKRVQGISLDSKPFRLIIKKRNTGRPTAEVGAFAAIFWKGCISLNDQSASTVLKGLRIHTYSINREYKKTFWNCTNVLAFFEISAMHLAFSKLLCTLFLQNITCMHDRSATSNNISSKITMFDMRFWNSL